MLDGNRAVVEVYIFNRQTQSLADTATEMEEHSDKQFIPHVECRLLKQAYFAWFKICFHSSSPEAGESSSPCAYALVSLSLRDLASLRAMTFARMRKPCSSGSSSS